MKRTGIFKVLNIIKNIICWTLIVCLVTVLVTFFMSRKNGETPSLFGYSILRVSSGSMEPELMVNDVILDHKVDDVKTLKVGDIITFRGSGQLEGRLVTHKIIKAPYSENGKLMLQTRGIANEIADQPIEAEDVRGIMICKIPYLDTVYNIFLSPWGLLILIGLIVLIFIDEIVTIVRILTGNDVTADEAEDINQIIERLQTEKAIESGKAKIESETTQAKNEIIESADNQENEIQ